MLGVFANSIFRHALGAAGGALVAKGVMDEATATQLIGALGTIAAVGLSFLEKRFRFK